jgi:predicted ATP-grasp superfamily ATP-dependent carboligase
MNKQVVLITGAHLQTGCCTARSLVGVDAQIIGLSANPYSRFSTSRFWDRIVTVDQSMAAHLDKLIDLGKSAPDKMTLFAAQDEVVQLMSANRDELGKYYNFVLPDQAMVDLMMDKTIFHPWAAERGFLVPESHIVESATELDHVLNTIQYPIILKPLYRTKKWMERSHGNKVYLLANRSQVDDIDFDLLDAAPKLLLQQFVPGGDGNVHFCLLYMDRDGAELGHYTGRKVLQWPHLTGSTAIGIGTVNERVHQLASEIMAQTGHRGLGSVEFKLSDEDGQYYITEPTVGRNNYQSYLAVAGGVNLTQIAYYDIIGQRPPVNLCNPKLSVWMDETYSSLAVGRHERRTLFTCKNLSKAVRRSIAFSHLNLADPMPFALFCAEQLPKRARQFARTALFKLSRHQARLSEQTLAASTPSPPTSQGEDKALVRP